MRSPSEDQLVAYLRNAELTTTSIGPDERRTIAIVESGEPLLPIVTACPKVSVKLRIPAREEYAGDDPLLARKTVCERLHALAHLVGPNWRVDVFDAFRPLAYQRWRYEKVLEIISSDNPGLSLDELHALTDRYVAFPSDDPTIPPPHSTGAAIDMLLVRADGFEPDYGSIPGNYSAAETPRHATNSPLVSGEQRANRLRLLRAAVRVGFANYPGEWWHYSFGDQEWCYQTRYELAARYGRID